MLLLHESGVARRSHLPPGTGLNSLHAPPRFPPLVIDGRRLHLATSPVRSVASSRRTSDTAASWRPGTPSRHARHWGLLLTASVGSAIAALRAKGCDHRQTAEERGPATQGQKEERDSRHSRIRPALTGIEQVGPMPSIDQRQERHIQWDGPLPSVGQQLFLFLKTRPRRETASPNAPPRS